MAHSIACHSSYVELKVIARTRNGKVHIAFVYQTVDTFVKDHAELFNESSVLLDALLGNVTQLPTKTSAFADKVNNMTKETLDAATTQSIAHIQLVESLKDPPPQYKFAGGQKADLVTLLQAPVAS